MKTLIRNYAPFIMLGYSLLFSIASYFGFYFSWYRFLPDLVGYSIFTNLFMYSVYMNKRYCTSTKVAVLGLLCLNVLNLVYELFNMNGLIYDVYLLIIVCLVLVIKKIM